LCLVLPCSFAFVTYAEKRDAGDAATEMDGKEIDGRVIKAKIARPRPPRDFGGGGGYRGGGGGYRGGGGHGASSVALCCTISAHRWPFDRVALNVNV
jgi:RNA recognition motif-containing protein